MYSLKIAGRSADDQPAARLRLQLLNSAAEALATGRKDATSQLHALRLAMHLLGGLQVTNIRPEVLTGYALMPKPPVEAQAIAESAAAFAQQYPQPDRQVNLELARLLGAMEAPDGSLKLAISAQLTPDSPLTDDLHYLIVLSRLPGARDAQTTQRIAACLMGLHAKMERAGALTSRNWPLRVAELVGLLMEADPALPTALLQTPGGFARVDHALFVSLLPKDRRAEASQRLLAAASAAKPDQITPELLQVLAELPGPEVLARFREWWNRPELRDGLLMKLARQPDEQDRPRYLQALSSRQKLIVDAAAHALSRLSGAGATPEELLLILQAYRQTPIERGRPLSRADFNSLLRQWSRQMKDAPPADMAMTEYENWRDWFVQAHPKLAPKLQEAAELDWPAFKKRLDSLDFAKGDAGRGKAVYQARACAACHAGGSRLGPDLAGVGKRFSRHDLFSAIVDPNQQVSPAYHPVRITTKDGQSHVGFLVYDSPETTLLQTGPGVTVRITGDQFQSQRTENISLMPAGLLNGIGDQDLVDLEAYLKGL